MWGHFLQILFDKLDVYLHQKDTYTILEDKVLSLEFDNEELQQQIEMYEDNINDKGVM